MKVRRHRLRLPASASAEATADKSARQDGPTGPSFAHGLRRPALGFVDDGGDTMPTHTLTCDLEASDATPGIRFSLDLLDWASHPPTFVSSVKQPDGAAILTFQAPWPLDDPAHPRGFFRAGVATP